MARNRMRMGDRISGDAILREGLKLDERWRDDGVRIADPSDVTEVEEACKRELLNLTFPRRRRRRTTDQLREALGFADDDRRQ